VRRQADTAWFRSWLLFDPVAAVTKVRQPLLVLHGALDREFPATYADLIEHAARARRNVTPAHTQKVVVPGVNHLLVPATSGEVSEYLQLPTRLLSAEISGALVSWLATAFTIRN
jgi:fermentation-respiration switch protein FrsA (DUF1100 family)